MSVRPSSVSREEVVAKLARRLVSADAAPAAGEPALVARLRADDDRACEILVRDHAPALIGAARRLEPRDDEANALVRDAFRAAFGSLRDLTHEARLSVWLHQRLLDTAFSSLEDRAQKPDLEALLPRFDATGRHLAAVDGDDLPDPTRPLQARVARRVREAVASLPLPYRATFILLDVEELSPEEAAALLHTTPHTLRAWRHRARQLLRCLLISAFHRDAAPMQGDRRPC